MKNLHLEHPEDTILTGDLSVLDWFKAEGQMSVKIDGAPAIVWGTDPQTCLLYTSPSPRDRQKSRMPSSA